MCGGVYEYKMPEYTVVDLIALITASGAFFSGILLSLRYSRCTKIHCFCCKFDRVLCPANMDPSVSRGVSASP